MSTHGRRHGTRIVVDCGAKHGCPGECPVGRVQAGFKPGGVKALCRECNRAYTKHDLHKALQASNASTNGGAAQQRAANAGAKESSKANKKIKDLEATSVARKQQREASEERLRRHVEEISQNLNAPVGKPSAQERLSALRARVRSRAPPQ